jgi:hypothetical protein
VNVGSKYNNIEKPSGSADENMIDLFDK